MVIMPEQKLRMAEMLCTRLCHDLTGPISAVSNGAEFISEDSFNMQGEAVDLIVSSAFSAVSRLQFYRFAYGRVKGQGEASLDDKKQLVEDFFRGTNVKLDWPDQYGDAAALSISWRMARMLFNLLVIVSGGLLKGGQISVRLQESDDHARQLTVTATGESIKWEPDHQEILQGRGNEENMDPKTVQMFLTAQLAEELGVNLNIESDSGKIEICAVQKNPEFLVPEISNSGGQHG